MGGSAEHMGTPRRAAPAMWNPQCEEGAGGGAASATWRGGGREGVSVRDIKGGGADRGHGDSTVCCIGYVEPHVDVKGLEDTGTGPWQCRRGGGRGCRQEG